MTLSPSRRKRHSGSFITVAAFDLCRLLVAENTPEISYRGPSTSGLCSVSKFETPLIPCETTDVQSFHGFSFPLQDPYLTASTPGGYQVRAPECAMASVIAPASGGSLLGLNGHSTSVCLVTIPSHPSRRVPFRNCARRLSTRPMRRPPLALPLALSPRADRSLLRVLHPECHR